PNLFSAQERARDTEKKNDARSVSLQLESYWNDNQTYPADLDSSLDSYGYNAADVNDQLTYAPLQDDGTTACTVEPCVAYELRVTLENVNDPDTDDDNVYTVTSINRPSGTPAE
ncbi:MAG: hypothetical protein WDZ42_00480, partial [Candidatus Saccharimonadales bacterium]